MTEFTPLRVSSQNDFERKLLSSTDREEPSAEALSKTALAIGVSTSALALTSHAGAAGALAGAGSASALSITLKSLFIGALGGLAVSTSAHAVFSSTDSAERPLPVYAAPPVPQVVTTATEKEAEPVTAVAVPAPAKRPAPASVRAADEPARPEPAAAAVPEAVPLTTPPEAPAVPPSGPVSIAEEVSAIARARQALKDGRATDALGELARYHARWPRGVLATEAQLLRIEAELAVGDRVAARRDARAFIAAQPSGRYAARVRALFEASELE